jgi:hypothetical protein
VLPKLPAPLGGSRETEKLVPDSRPSSSQAAWTAQKAEPPAGAIDTLSPDFHQTQPAIAVSSAVGDAGGSVNGENGLLSNSPSGGAQTAKRSAMKTGSDRVPLAPVQVGASPGDATLPVRDAGGFRESSSPSPDSSRTAGDVVDHNAFDALDSGPFPSPPAWTHAGPQQAEAGFEDPALGWIGVRADRNGGGVHASLIPGSVDAAQNLAGHMEGLNAYLATQHTAVESLGVAAPEVRNSSLGTSHSAATSYGGGSETGAGSSMNQGMQQGAHRDGGQPAGEAAAARTAVRASSSNFAEDRASAEEIRTEVRVPIPDASSGRQSMNGAHISVMA